MSMDQVSKPRSAKYSIAEECGRPSTWRSKVGCEAIEEPCKNRTVPFLAPPGALSLSALSVKAAATDVENRAEFLHRRAILGLHSADHFEAFQG